MRGKITKRSVDALKPSMDGSEQILWDSIVAGFGVRVQRGNTKTYILKYRFGSGRSARLRKYTIGRHGSPWTADTARSEAKRLLGLVAADKDPAGDKSASRGVPTVENLAEHFLAEHAEAKRKASTAKEYRRLIEHVVLPVLGKKRVTEVTRQDVARLHYQHRSTPIEANRTLAVLSTMFNFAERRGERADASNPCRHIEKYPQHRRERYLSSDELGRLGDALNDSDGSPYALAAIKLLIFSGARLSEILDLRWDWVDFERGEARLPDSKTGAKTVHLPPPAIEVLRTVVRVDGNPHVIVGGKEGTRLVNLEKPWRRLREHATILLWMGAADTSVARIIRQLSQELERSPTFAEIRAAARKSKLELPTGMTDVRLHDLRHAFASIAAASGMGLPIIGKMLGHSQAATTARYAHLAPDPVKAAAAVVADKIAGAMRKQAVGT